MKIDDILFRTIFDQSNVGIVILQPDDLCLKNCNNAFYQIVGYAADELKDKKLEDISHREDWAAEKRDFTSILQGEIDSSQCEKRFINKNGEAIWTNIVTTSCKDEKGTILHIIQFVQNITLHKQSLLKIEQQEHFVRNVIDAVPNLITVKDKQGKYTLVNLATAEFYGHTVDEMEGITDEELGHQAGNPEKIRREDLEVIETLQEKFILEQTVRDVTGHSRVWQTYRRPIYVETSEGYQVLTVATDVTDFKKLAKSLEEQEKKLQQERGLLEERVKLRTADFDLKIAETNKLLQTYKYLLSILSHESRLSINDQQTLALLISDMLEVVKLETEKKTPVKNSVSIEEIKESLNQIFSARTQNKRLRVNWKSDPNLTTLQTNKDHLQQIAQNIISVLTQITPAENEISLEIKGDKFCKVADIVIQTALSEIPATELSQMAQDNSLQEEHVHQNISKLSLILASRLAKLQGGEIRIDSEGHQGIKITLSLPWEA